MKRTQVAFSIFLALGIFSLISPIRATEPSEVDANDDAIGEPFAPDEGVRISLPLQISKSENFSLGAVTEASNEEESASELNRKLYQSGEQHLVHLVKIQLAVQYMPVHPRISGQEWNVQVSVTPVIPKLIKGVLFE